MKTSVSFNAKIVPVKPINDEFTLCKCYVMALGKNRNYSFFSKDAADDAAPTIFNIPVIGHLYIDEDGEYIMGGHDRKIVSEDGTYKFKSLCVPFGTVPNQDSLVYEDITEPDGTTKTYLVSDVILWTGRFPELKQAIYSDDIYFGQSMEINVIESNRLEEDKKYTNIVKYSYSALCLLGKSDDKDKHVEPCFPMASVQPYEYSIDDKFAELMEQFMFELKNCFGDNIKEGGSSDMENETVVIKENSVVESQVEVPTETEEEVQVDNDVESDEVNTESVEPEVFESTEEVQQDSNETRECFSTYSEKWDAICKKIRKKCTYDEYYGLNDFDDYYVYCYHMICTNDDYEEEYVRMSYSYNDETFEVEIGEDAVRVFLKWCTKEDMDAMSAKETRFAELEQYVKERERQDHEFEIDAVITEFSDLMSSEEFASLIENKYSYKDANALRKECYAIRGMMVKPQTKKSEEVIIPIACKNKKSQYDEFMEKYGNR